MALSVLSSVLPVSFCWSLGTAPETDQRLTLIYSEWSRRRDRELCDYWTSTLYQFQSFYNTWLSHTRCIMHSVWSPGIQSYGCYWSWEIFLHFSWGGINFVIKSATGSNPLITSTDQSWRSEKGTISCNNYSCTAFKVIDSHFWGEKYVFLLTRELDEMINSFLYFSFFVFYRQQA